MRPLRFTPWMLKYPDDTESGPHDHEEVASILRNRKDACWIRIRARNGDIWSPIHLHSGWEKYLSEEKRQEMLETLQPEQNEPEAVQPLSLQTEREFTTVREILDYNAACEKQPLTHGDEKRPRKRAKAWKRRTTRGEFVKSFLFFNSAYLIFCLILYILGTDVVFQSAGQLPLDFIVGTLMFANPIASSSFWVGAIFINLSICWMVFIIGIHR